MSYANEQDLVKPVSCFVSCWKHASSCMYLAANHASWIVSKR